MVKITEIAVDGIAANLDLLPGDRVVSVNGQVVRDFLDVLLAEAFADVIIVVEKNNGDLWQLDIEKNAGEPFGFELEHPEPKRCGNNCIFCFVHQLPKGMRQTLYIKDEDYRFSYLYGAYITLSNLVESDIKRIIEQQLSPLYISVHAVNNDVRSHLLGREVPPILPIMQRLADAGIELHTQIVVCPGVNDEAVLVDSVEALSALHPAVRSLALVPVGLTEHRRNLEPLAPVTADVADNVIHLLSAWQQKFSRSLSSRFVYAADEFYLKAGKQIPELAEYEELAQIENGVGMVALFRDEACEVLQEADALHCPVEFSAVTGRAFHSELQSFLKSLSTAISCTAHLYEIENKLFGAMVTVAGLIGGHDIAAQLAGKDLGSVLLVPDVMMRDGANHFLDDMTPEQLGEALGCRVAVISSDPWGILEAIEALTA